MRVEPGLSAPMVMMSNLVPTVLKYVFTPRFVFLNALGTIHRYLVGVGVYRIATMGCCCHVSFSDGCGLNAESTCLV